MKHKATTTDYEACNYTNPKSGLLS